MCGIGGPECEGAVRVCGHVRNWGFLVDMGPCGCPGMGGIGGSWCAEAVRVCSAMRGIRDS